MARQKLVMGSDARPGRQAPSVEAACGCVSDSSVTVHSHEGTHRGSR